LAILLTLLAGTLLGTWVVQDRVQAGAAREAASQAQARTQHVQATRWRSLPSNALDFILAWLLQIISPSSTRRL